MSDLPEDPFTPLTPDQLNDLRLRCIRGEEPSPEEMQAVVQTMQMARSSLAAKAKPDKKPRKSATRTPPPSLDHLLSG